VEHNIIHKSDLGSGDLHFVRLDAEYVSPSLYFDEKKLRKKSGKELHGYVEDYCGPYVTKNFVDSDSVISYVDIDAVDTLDGLTYAETLL
jgi:hypothetical protein